MGYVVCFFMAFFLGRKYQELMDLMMARRIAKMVSQSEQIAKEKAEYDRAVALDRRYHKKMFEEKNEEAEEKAI
ncbi:hypothetical protein ACTID9_28725 (plasmid) [Brevibacillus fluminis]|uniref:hypothetical protein n=1 Tax=Brevibacillus fluminis TaxID=511487 RepID=UPI003F89E5C0